MLRLVTMYGLTPVLAGNAAAWSLYFRIKRAVSALKRRMTLQRELLEAAAREAEQRERRRVRQVGTLQGSTPPETAETMPASKSPEGFSTEAVLFGPESAGGPSAFHSEEEEVMLLYMDDGEDEAGDN